MADPAKITERSSKRSQRKLLRRLLVQDAELASAFRRYADTTAEILSRYRAATVTLWNRSPQLRQEITEASLQLKTAMETIIGRSTQYAWMAANEKNDYLIRDFVEGLPLSGRHQMIEDPDDVRMIRERIFERAGLFSANLQAYDRFVNRRTAGMGLSDNVWNIAKESRRVLEYYLDSGIATGRAATELSRDIRQLLNKPDSLFRRVRNPDTGEMELSRPAKAYHPGRGVYRSAYKNALRLARTETNMAYHTADHERWKGIDWIIGFEVKLSAQHPVYDICDEMAGRYPKQFKFIGWHPQCLCYAVPILPTQDEMLDNVMDGKPMANMVEQVPESFDRYVEIHSKQISGWENQPYWVRDNFKGGRIDGGLRKDIITPTPAKAAVNA